MAHIERSISDDDLCATCANCLYRPGDMSGCKLDFPGETDANGYFIACGDFAPCAAGANVLELRA